MNPTATTVLPPALQRGDTVALAAPARWVTPEQVEPAVRVLEGWGLRVLIPDGLFARDGQLAGSDSHRAALFQRLLDDPSVRAIVCARGGYGTVRIVDRLDWSAFAQSPKWVVGFSDATVLHSHIHTRLGIATLHATMPALFPDDYDDDPDSPSFNPAVTTLGEWLFGRKPHYQWQSDRLARPGRAKAPVVGGNLSVLYSLCGSPSALDTRGKILLLEDLDEYLYHIDRMMQNLLRNGMLDRLAGLVVGGMTQMHDNSVPFGEEAYDIIRRTVAPFGYPVAFHAPFGHDEVNNLALPLGAMATLRVGRDASASLDFSA